MTRFVVYDVFTDVPFGGNQLAVIPDATALAEDDLQKIAREFNFSETTFVYPPADPANTAKVRIFTPTRELPFAGHPTIGTAAALRDLGQVGDMALEMALGVIPCRFNGSAIAFTVTAPLKQGGTIAVDLVARALGLDADSLVTDTHQPTKAGHGASFVHVELKSRAALSACSPDISVFREAVATTPDDPRLAIYAYARNDNQIDARMFAPLGGTYEDPATGSAASALAAYLADILGRDLKLTIRQGYDMGRPSQIGAATAPGDPISVTISGSAVQTMQGTLTHPGTAQR